MPQAARQTPHTAPMPSHRDIMARLDEQENQHNLTALTLQRVEKKLDDVLKAIGGEGEDEYGKPIGTGIVGRLMRLEIRVDRRERWIDGWRRYVVGAAAAAVLLGGALWWLVGPKLGQLLR